MIAVPASQLTIGYWNCRALGAPLRMMAAFKQIDYRDKHYEVSRAQRSPAAIDEIAVGDNLQIQCVSACVRACVASVRAWEHVSPQNRSPTSAFILQVPN